MFRNVAAFELYVLKRRNGVLSVEATDWPTAWTKRSTNGAEAGLPARGNGCGLTIPPHWRKRSPPHRPMFQRITRCRVALIGRWFGATRYSEVGRSAPANGSAAARIACSN